MSAPENVFGTNVTTAPSSTDTQPPFSLIPSAVPPERTVAFATPPDKIFAVPPERTVALAVPPLKMQREPP